MSLKSVLAAYHAGRLDVAEKRVSEYLAKRPFDDAALHIGAVIALDRKDVETAQARIAGALSAPADRPTKLNTQGSIQRLLGEEVLAKESFKAALHQTPDYIEARFNLAKLFAETGCAQEAADTFAEVAAANPDDLAAWRGRISALFDMMDIPAIETVLKVAPISDEEATLIRATLSSSLGQRELARAQLEPCLDDPVTQYDAMKLALQTLYMDGRAEDARQLIEDMTHRHPDAVGVWTAAIFALVKSHDLDAAKALLDRAPTDFSLELAQLDIEITEMAFDQAVTRAMAALEARPGDVSILQRLCFAALGSGQYDAAQMAAAQAARLAPNNQLFHALKATSMRALGQDHRRLFDYDRFVHSFDLEPPPGWETIEAFNTDLKAELDALHAEAGAPIEKTLRSDAGQDAETGRSSQTSLNLKYARTPAIRAFFKAVDPAIRAYIRSLPRDPKHPFLRQNRGGYHVRGGWSVRQSAGGYHVDHIHPEGWISSAYYVEVPETDGKEGWIKFGEPAAPLSEALGQEPEHEVEPVAGRVVLFPSYMWHGTYPIRTSEWRTTLPIDIMPNRSFPKFET